MSRQAAGDSGGGKTPSGASSPGGGGLLSKLKLDKLSQLPGAAALGSPFKAAAGAAASTVRRVAPSASETGDDATNGDREPPANGDDYDPGDDETEGGRSGRSRGSGRRSDEEIIATLPAEFFDEQFNPTAFLLHHLPDRIDDAFFDRELYEKERAHDIMNSRLSKKVMNNYGEFVSGMTQIHELSVDLQTSATVCKTGRRGLQQAKHELVERVVHIVATHRRLRMFQEIHRQALIIRAVLNAAQDVKRRQAEGDWPGAIQVLLAVRSALAQLKQLQCVKQLAHSLQLQYQLVVDRLEQQLSQLVRAFEPRQLARVLVGLRLLGQSYLVLDKLQHAFIELVAVNSKNVLYAHALMSEQNARNPEALKRMKFNELCGAIREEHFATALDSLLEITSELMFVQHQMLVWLRSRPSSQQLVQPLQAPAILAELPGAAQADAATVSGEAAGLDEFLGELRDGLEKFKRNIWEDVQRKVASLLAAGRVTQLKIDETLRVLEHVNAFVEIGEQFADGSEAHTLRGALRQLSRTYLDAWHRQRAEDLQTMLDNEAWQRCPVTPSFSVHDIKEIKALLVEPPTPPAASSSSSSSTPAASAAVGQSGASGSAEASNGGALGPGGAYHSLSLFGTLGNPFAKGYKPRVATRTDGAASEASGGQGSASQQQPESSDDDETDAPEAVEDGIDSDATRRAVNAAAAAAASADQQGPLMTTTTINLCRHLAKYIQLMKLMQPIAFELFEGLQQLYHFYVYAVYAMFGEEAPTALIEAGELGLASAYQMSPRLRSTLAKLQRQFRPPPPPPPTTLLGQSEFGKTLQNAMTLGGASAVPPPPPPPPVSGAGGSGSSLLAGGSADGSSSGGSGGAGGGAGGGGSNSSTSAVQLRLSTTVSPMVELRNAATLYGLPQRVVAVESLSFLQAAINAFRPHLLALLPRARERQVVEFYAQSVDVLPELARYVYKTVAIKLINWDGLVPMVERVKWDIKELGTEGSPYVDRLVADFKGLAKRLNPPSPLGRSLPARVRELVWQATVTHACELLVEGYSRVKKCTNEGRAIMSLDLNNLRTTLEDLSKLRPLPGVKYVEAYIKAYYLAEVDILPWCREHQADYSLRQLQSVVTLGVGRTMKKNKLDELLSILASSKTR